MTAYDPKRDTIKFLTPDGLLGPQEGTTTRTRYQLQKELAEAQQALAEANAGKPESQPDDDFEIEEIEKEIPIPDRSGKLGITWRQWPFERMNPGDSFLMRCTNPKKRGGTLGHAITRHRKDHPEEVFTVRKVEGGLRCWRIR